MELISPMSESYHFMPPTFQTSCLGFGVHCYFCVWDCGLGLIAKSSIELKCEILILVKIKEKNNCYFHGIMSVFVLRTRLPFHTEGVTMNET